jgi:peptide/nickel transport system substrate-binding protein
MNEKNYWTARRLSRRRILRGAAVGAAGLAGAALIGCGDDDDDEQVAAAPTATAAAGGTAAAGTAAAGDGASGGITSGGTLKVALSASPNFVRIPLNTAGGNTPINQTYSLFNRLVRVGGSELVTEPGDYANLTRMVNQDWNINPDLAKSWENPDPLKWIFKVRTDAKFHTGRGFTAEDVAFTYEAIKDEEVGGGGSPLNLMAANLGDVTAVDDETVEIGLTRPTGYFGTLAANTNIADRDTLDQVTDGVLIGTGPYTFENFDPNRGYELVANEDYHEGRPNLDRIEATIFADNAAAGLALETGDLHWSWVGVGTPEAEQRILKSADHYGRIGTGQGGRVIRLRADLPPTDDKRVRQGLMELIDRVRITEEFAGSFDVAGRLHWQPSSAAYNAEMDRPVFDPAEAAKKFDAAGIRGTTLRADILPERLDAPALAQLLQQELAQMDITLEIVPREYTEMITLQTTGTFEHMIVGFGNWVKPGDPAVTVLFADSYDGRMNAPSETDLPLRERPGIKNELEWLDMIEAAKNGEVEDWDAWNEKQLDVAWSNVLFRQYSAAFYTNNFVHPDGFDANGWAYYQTMGLV